MKLRITKQRKRRSQRVRNCLYFFSYFWLARNRTVLCDLMTSIYYYLIFVSFFVALSKTNTTIPFVVAAAAVSAAAAAVITVDERVVVGWLAN